MKLRALVFVLGNLLILFGLVLLVPMSIAFIYPSPHITPWQEALAFIIPGAIAAILGGILRYFFRSHKGEVRAREGFAIVTFSWLLMVTVGMMPYLLAGVTDSITDAFFETMSGFTTTGATIFPVVEKIPHAVQFWRHMTQWLGGMGIVVLSVALLPMLGVGGYRMLKAEAPGGVAFERERPRITDAAKELWRIYLIFTIIEAVILWALGMTPYDAICHSFTTMSTGGFSTHSASIAFFPSASIQWVIIAFMFVAGMNFSLHAHAFRLNVGPWKRDSEVHYYVGIAIVFTLLGFFLIPSSHGAERHLRDVAFQVISISTTTGYATADYDVWPQVFRLLMVGLMFVGGSMGSTGGGMKVARILVYGKTFVRELHRLVFPHGIRPIRLGPKVIEESIAANILAFGLVYVSLFVMGTIVMTAYDYDLVTSASAAASAIGNIGPGLGKVGPTANWAHLPDGAKWVMAMLMMLGRLEIFSV
ncbi:TrkH family potassium uptake protein, partial [Myxococcota bacterium]|nr:TrkH family potassium uptake protein [Myxococcota bacterium]